ncbi:MAG: hypothetical protein JXB88_13960 [Spirochaetales bacterium]|nr:hypothetical protein [Spirochaetales bacterium]
MQKKSYLLYGAGFILFFLLFSSCSAFFFPEPYDVIQGKHCIVFITNKDIGIEEYKNICTLGDRAYEAVVTCTGLEFTRAVSIIYEPEFINEFYYGIACASYFSVFWGDDFLNLPPAEKKSTLQHEIAHIIIDAYFGEQDLFVLSEGIAVYIENDRSIHESSGIKTMIGEYLSLMYFDYFSNYDYYLNQNLIHPLYRLSGEFVEFWCETYGMENFYSLYRNASINNLNEMMEKYGDTPFETIINEFISF